MSVSSRNPRSSHMAHRTLGLFRGIFRDPFPGCIFGQAESVSAARPGYRKVLPVAVALALTACGGGGGGGGGGSGTPTTGGGSVTPGTPPSSGATTTFAGLDATQVSNAVAAAIRMADARPRAGSVTQSSNAINGVTADRVSVTTAYGASGPEFTVRNGSDWSIGTANGNPRRLAGVSAPFVGVELHRRVSGGTLYADVYSDIEAPVTRQVGGNDDGTRDLPLGTLVAPRNLSGSSGGYSNDNANVGGESGHVRCSGGCTISDGVATAGTWTFTPDRPPGAVDISGVSGVSFTGQFDPARTSGTYNGRSGFFRCLSLSCGRTITNGRVSALEGQWIFIPAGGTTTTTPDTDYLSAGVWLFVPDDATSADDFTIGAFADGSDPFVQGNIRELRGTASYNGLATGVYTARSDAGTDAGYWNGAVGLTADFGGTGDLGTISGRVAGLEVDGASYPGSLTLGSANISSASSGFFHGQLGGTAGGVGYSGRWGGQFFGNGEAHGEPGSVVGTLGGRAMDGSATFTGVFGAYNDGNRR